MRIRIRNILISQTSTMHYFKLIFRSLLFVCALVMYIISRATKADHLFATLHNQPLILKVIWLVFVVEMAMRFFPAKIESMGCQKQFAHNYQPVTHAGEPVVTSDRLLIKIALGWIGMNAVFGGLYLTGVFDRGIMLLISLAYSICDIICILFFCPFETWFMKNKCCGTCRIYNWDYAMMFTPLLFVGGWYCWSILALALGLFAQWELRAHLHPERFSESTNAALSCANCEEHLCHHKKQLQSFHKNNKELMALSREYALRFVRTKVNVMRERTDGLMEELKEKKDDLMEEIRDHTKK